MSSTTVKAPSRSSSFTKFLANNGALVGLVVLCIALFIATPDFLTGRNLLNIGIQVSTVAVLAFGVTFVIVAGGIDLSVGSVAALSAMVSGWFFATAGLPGWLALVGGLVAGLATGVVNGLASAYGKLPSFIATLAMLSVARGLTLVLSDGKPVPTSPQVSFLGSDIGPVPVPIIVLVLAALVASFILNRTVIGRSMYAVGGNAEAARLSGLPVKRIVVVVFALSGLFAALAGLLLAGRLDSAQPQAASGYELDAIASVVIGGASLAGGVGRISGTFIGALVLVVIRNGLNLLNVSSFWQQVVIGLVIAIAVGFDVLRRKTRSS
ncbi:ABC transporter permease [Curtobacterium sp. MCJR17_055]|jgi:ribose transport system permease protein|uniref:ABC transporter permease n=1 Tax=unclassified Curtobacterium TaxID=257496 RepID=UPI000D809177|nr:MULTISPECIES: ABC transporter permease [unclassified Curtobacterium]PYY34666.1 ABC transporter permease [Curtobacterium sp. MCBD17_029]PYY57517.1 ABC transporter permease [Curtobacterium sp. MCPF17_015]PYY58173.1 ABC transporter permease [Curtobacterium sp. MCJR17_055]PZE81274.1 ABC transporter permease [Curtobacterium sp. MCBD17_032]PZE93500.1 ABC transporter permease [Curtobacterium sp. MCBD17_008]